METMRGKKQVFLPGKHTVLLIFSIYFNNFLWNKKKIKFNLFVGEVKCLMTQLLKAVHHLHDNWILHRDLKTSNLLLSHKGVLKVTIHF